MTYKFHFLSVLALLLFFRPEAGAQTIPVNTKFGAVSDAELEMTVYPPDTSAAVVVLYRNQEVEATISSALGFARRIIHTERIKILKESGKDYADFKIYYSTDCEPREYVEGIKVVTYNKENGKTIVNKLPRKLIFDEEVSGKIHLWSTGGNVWLDESDLLRVFSQMNRDGQTILMVTHSTDAASNAGRVLFIRDGVVFHQLFRGDNTNEAFYKRISDTLTMLRTGRDSE